MPLLLYIIFFALPDDVPTATHIDPFHATPYAGLEIPPNSLIAVFQSIALLL